MIDKATRAAVADLWGNHNYRLAVGVIEKLAVVVPTYDPAENNVEQMKFDSARKQMHDLVMAILKPKEE